MTSTTLHDRPTQALDRVRARYEPRHLKTANPDAVGFVGYFTAGWIVEHEHGDDVRPEPDQAGAEVDHLPLPVPEQGMWAWMTEVGDWPVGEVTWVPAEDLVAVEET